MLYENFNTTNQTSPYYLKHDNFVQDVQMVSCGWVLTIDPKARCSYVTITPQCAEDVYIFNYVELYYCKVDTSNTFFVILGILALFLCCAVLFYTLGATADGFFCPSLKVVSALMGLNEDVAGVTLLAFGNCAPDMITNITGLSGESRRLYSDTLGSSMFVVFCVAGTIVAYVPFIAQPSHFQRDCLFLLLSVVLVDYCMITDLCITLTEGIVILSLYLLYIIVVCLDQYLLVRKLKAILRDDTASASSFPSDIFARLSRDVRIELHSYPASQANERHSIPYNTDHGPNYELFEQFIKTLYPIEAEAWNEASRLGKCVIIMKAPIIFILKVLLPVVDFELEDHGWSKLLNCMQVITLPSFVIWALTVNNSFIDNRLWLWTLVISVPLSVIIFLKSRTDTTPSFHKYLAILAALGSVYFIYACAAETISILSVLGLTTNRSNSFLGCTLLAWGNSIGDLVANVALARQGYQKMGFAACFGGPLFNTLLGIGIGMTYKASISPELKTNKKSVAEGTMGVNNTIFLIIGLILLLFGASSTNYIMRRSIGIFMLTIYAIFLIVTLLGELELIHYYGSDHRLDMKLEESDLIDMLKLKSSYPFVN